MIKTYLNILEEIGWPNIYLISSRQFEKVDGDKMRGLYGNSAVVAPIITINTGLRGKVLKNTIYHELGHLLFPSKPHWWVYIYGTIMAKGGDRSDTKPYYQNHTLDDLPSRDRLLHLTQLAAKRFNEKTRIGRKD